MAHVQGLNFPRAERRASAYKQSQLFKVEIVGFTSTISAQITAYAAVFSNVDSHKDVIEPGAFTDTLAEHKRAGTTPHMLVMHGMGSDNAAELPVGAWTHLSQDSKGLYAEGKLILANSRARDIHELVKARVLTGASIGFRSRRFVIHPAGQKADGRRRTLLSVHLGEVSLVTDPSNGLAHIQSVKSADPVLSALKRLAESLR